MRNDSLLFQQYERYLSNYHLEIGAKSHDCLWRSLKSSHSMRLTLIDKSWSRLKKCRHKLGPVAPNLYQADITESLDFITERFQSISLFDTLNSLPGTIYDKQIVFKHAKRLLSEDGVLFGTTKITDKEEPTSIDKWLTSIGIKKSIRSRREDVEKVLRQFFDNVTIITTETTLLFAAH